jgi:predicted flavoprotein YhiN
MIIIGSVHRPDVRPASRTTRAFVVLLDHSSKLGEDRISGGGRCNFTNLNAKPENYLSQNPHFCRSALARFTPQHFIAMLDKHGIGYHEKTLGQLFCDDEAEVIVAMLRGECDAAGVKRFMNCEIEEIKHPLCRGGWRRQKAKFYVSTSRGEFEAVSLVIATGGLSIPNTGATRSVITSPSNSAFRSQTQAGHGTQVCAG